MGQLFVLFYFEFILSSEMLNRTYFNIFDLIYIFYHCTVLKIGFIKCMTFIMPALAYVVLAHSDGSQVLFHC